MHSNQITWFTTLKWLNTAHTPWSNYSGSLSSTGSMLNHSEFHLGHVLLVEALHHHFNCPCFTVAVNLHVCHLCSVKLWWHFQSMPELNFAWICVNKRPVWSITCLTNPLKRNEYSLSYNIWKLTRKERISGDIATIIALQPNQWSGSPFMNVAPSIVVLCLLSGEQHPHKYSWNPAEYDAWQSCLAGEKQWVIQTLYWHKHHCLSFRFERYFDLLTKELSLISFLAFSPIFITWVTSVARRSEQNSW